MTTMTVRSHVGPDGTLRLEVPSGLPPGPVEVVVIVQPAAPPEQGASDDRAASGEEPRPHRARSGLFLNHGAGGVDLDSVAGEVEAAWKAKLADLEP